MPDGQEPPEWREDRWSDRRRIRNNVSAVIHRIASEAKSRPEPSLDMVRQWHRDTYSGVWVPIQCYTGTFRGDPVCPELLSYGVVVGGMRGAQPADVKDAVNEFEERMQRGVAILDPLIPVGVPPQTAEELRAVVNLAAPAHGEWIRIHPFANGNGRTARMWGNWVALRYSLRPFIRLRPRPAGSMYAAAAAASMQRDHTATAVLFTDWLTENLRRTA